jgi:hypothetical protein
MSRASIISGGDLTSCMRQCETGRSPEHGSLSAPYSVQQRILEQLIVGGAWKSFGDASHVEIDEGFGPVRYAGALLSFGLINETVNK